MNTPNFLVAEVIICEHLIIHVVLVIELFHVVQHLSFDVFLFRLLMVMMVLIATYRLSV